MRYGTLLSLLTWKGNIEQRITNNDFGTRNYIAFTILNFAFTIK